MPSLEIGVAFFSVTFNKNNFIPHSLTFLYNKLNNNQLQSDGWISTITKPSQKGMNHHFFEQNQ